MKGSVQTSVLLVLIFLVKLQNASAEHCVHCIHLDFTPSPPPGFPNIYKNAHCKDYNSVILAANSHDCPNDGQNYLCGAIMGNYTFDVPSAGITTVEATLRRCVVHPQSLDDLKGDSPICLQGANLDKATNDIQLVGATEEFGDMTKFDGQVCYCKGHNCNAANAFGRKAVLASLVVGTLAALFMY